MRLKRTTVVTALASVLVSALVAAPAFATITLPNFVTHEPTEPFKGHFVGGTSFRLENGNFWIFSSGTISGEIVPGKEFPRWGDFQGKELKNVTVKFSGGSEGACYSKLTSPKELVWTNLHGWLGYANKTTKEVGLLLFSNDPMSENKLGRCSSNRLGTQEFYGTIGATISSPGESEFTHKLLFNGHDGVEGPSWISVGIYTFPPELRLGYNEVEPWNIGISGEATFETPNGMHIEY